MKTLLILILSINFCLSVKANDPWAYYKSDDFKHYQAGIMINGAACSSVYLFTGNYKKSLVVGNVVSIGTTVAKEVIYDGLMKRGTKSVADAVNGVMGSVLKSFVFIIYIDTKNKKQEKINAINKFENLNTK